MAVPRLPAADLREYAGRDWGMPEGLARRRRAGRPVAEKVRIAIGLYEAMRATRPDWPTETVRRADLATHLRVRALLDAAAMSIVGEALSAVRRVLGGQGLSWFVFGAHAVAVRGAPR